MRTHVYFLIYRRRIGRKIRFDMPTGGLVMTPSRSLNGIPVPDFQLAGDVAAQRYHCQPDEELILAEVFTGKERRHAAQLFKKWESEMNSFLELMGAR